DRLAAVGTALWTTRPPGPRGTPARPGRVAAARRFFAGAVVDRLRVRPRRPDHRVRPPRAHVQAAHAQAARPGAAQGRPARPGTARAAGGGGQVAPGRR